MIYRKISVLFIKSAIAQVVKEWQCQQLVAGLGPGRRAKKSKPLGPGVMGITSTVLPGSDVPHSINVVHIKYLVAHIREKGHATMTNDWSITMDGQLTKQCKGMDSKRRHECAVDKKTTLIIQLNFGFTTSATSTVHASLTLASILNMDNPQQDLQLARDFRSIQKRHHNFADHVVYSKWLSHDPHPLKI